MFISLRKTEDLGIIITKVYHMASVITEERADLLEDLSFDIWDYEGKLNQDILRIQEILQENERATPFAIQSILDEQGYGHGVVLEVAMQSKQYLGPDLYYAYVENQEAAETFLTEVSEYHYGQGDN